MSKLNKKVTSKLTTHEGAKAPIINPEFQLRRSVMSCLLWESEFYENGTTIAERIVSLVHANKPETVATIAIEAREKMKLRHVPLLLVRELARHKSKDKVNVADTISRVIQRADELTEFLAIYWKDGKEPLSGQVKKGLAKAFQKFSAYDLAKYNRDEAVKLRDVLFLCHAKPVDDAQAEVWKQLVEGTLASPDTWEVELSSSKDKKASWERLLTENKLGALALIRNLRNMKQAKVDEKLVFGALDVMKVDRVLPFRFVTAARFNPEWEDKLEKPMLRCLESAQKLPGKTILLIDVSGSMDAAISAKSDATRIDVASGLAILLREISEAVIVHTFSNDTVQVPARRGFALRDAINGSQPHGGTRLGHAVEKMNVLEHDRLIVITDEQSQDAVTGPRKKGYMINVASAKNGVGYGRWTHFDGFSEAVIDFIREYEKGVDSEK